MEDLIVLVILLIIVVADVSDAHLPGVAPLKNVETKQKVANVIPIAIKLMPALL